MPTVFIRSIDRPSFHKTKDCPQLNKAPARGTAHPVQEVDLADLRCPRPCRDCYPDAPKAKIVRRVCGVCNPLTAVPCAHNGGVRVTYVFQTTYTSLLRDPGDEATRERWIWPDHAWFYEPVAI